MAAAGFQNPLGLMALASIVVFIILYLRRPKPKDQVIPSLMFIINDQQKNKRFSFFRRLISNLLFLIQILALIGLAVSIASPFINVPYDTTLENTAIVIDVSASMQTKDIKTGETSFQKAIEVAKKSVSGRNSIILAENTPLIILENEDTNVALDVLGKIKPKATTTNLGDALLLAKDILGDNPGRIILISDFAATEGPDVKVVRTAVSSEDRIVDFVDVSVSAENVGIVRMESNKHTTKIYIKNFNNAQKIVSLTITKDNKKIASSNDIKIAPRSIENFEFDTVEGIMKIELTPRDALEVDDIAYVATPAKLKHSVLLITNEKNSNLEYALSSASDILLDVVNPPVLTINTKREKVDPFSHDAIIVHNINNANKKDGILPGTFSDIESYVAKGGRAIISAQEDLKEMDIKSLEIVELKNIINTPSKVCVESINQVTKQFQKEKCFAAVSQYFSSAPKKDVIIFASASDKSPMIAFSSYKKGKVVYYGIIDDASDFKTLPSYPVFWDSIVNFVVEAEDIKDYNFRTGKIIVIDEQDVKTPHSTFKTSKLLLDEAGIYEYNQKKFAVNLLDDKESDITIKTAEEQKSKEELVKRQQRQKDFNMEFLIIFLAFVLIISELVIIKFRGDL